MRDSHQNALPLYSVTPSEIAKEQSFAGSIELCARTAGYSLDKQEASVVGMDKARWSRIKAGTEGIKWEQLQTFMGLCGNDAPLLWMLHQRGYDLNSIRKRETETEKLLRQSEERLAEAEMRNRVLLQALTGRTS